MGNDRYEYVWVEIYSDQLNKLGNEGWRVVPGVFNQRSRDNAPSVLMELTKEPKETKVMGDDLEIKEETPVETCGATRAARWAARATCSFPKHGPDTPHSWVATT